jgi:penicillin-binding protein 1A
LSTEEPPEGTEPVSDGPDASDGPTEAPGPTDAEGPTDAGGPTEADGPTDAEGPADADGPADAEGSPEADGPADAEGSPEAGPRDRRAVIAAWVGGVLGGLALLFGLFLALPYGAAATVMQPVLRVVGAGPGLPADLDAPAERSVVLAADGTELATLSGEENRVVVELEEVPQVLQDAVLAIEDVDFRDHAGVDHRAIVRAAFANLRARGVVQGASTITQQYVKNAVLTSDRTVERKTTEMRYAIDLERRLDKDEILERYLNIAYFGEGVYGVATAAEYYLSKDLAELTLDEAALLAGLISQPERTNPAEDLAAATARRNLVLERMAEEDLVSADEAAQAQDAEIALELTPLPPPENPFFVRYVTQLLFEDEALGDSRDARQQEVFGGGLRIQTTLDPRLQAAAEGTIAEVLTDPVADPLGSLVSIEPWTGAIRALAVGPKAFGPCDEGEEPCETTQVNPAVPGMGGSGRQPGSAFKPIVIAAALEEGLPRGWQEVTDSETEIEGCDDYAPRNFDPDDGGDKAMAEAVEVSNNVYHAALIGHLQPEPVVEMATTLGVPDRDLPRQCSLALGSATVFPVDLAAAFATFANEGTRCEPYPIQAIVRGDEVLREHEPTCEEAIDPELAHEVTDLLQGPVTSGTATAAQLDRPVAGKTGTTDDFHDAWFVGYVPQLVTAAWVGFEQPAPMESILGVDRVTGGTVPAELWAAYMRVALEEVEVVDFPEPPPLEQVQVPDAEDRDVDDVTDALGEYDLHVLTETVEHWEPAGTVVDQEPEAGTEVARGHLLRLAVSDGTGEPPEVPDVVGLDEEEARELLEDADYEVEVEEEQREATLAPGDDPGDLDPPDGSVTAQSPGPGRTLEPGETVTITVVRYDTETADDGEVQIGEVRVHADPDREYVTLRNEGDDPADVAGWAIETDGGDRLEIGGGYVIPPGGSLRVHTGSGTDGPDRYHAGRGESVLEPRGGTLRLLDAGGDEVFAADY